MKNENEFKDILTRIRATFGLREGTLAMFLITVILLKVTGFVFYFKQANWVIFAIAVWFASGYVFRFLTEKQTTASGLINLYLIYDIFMELPILSFIVYNAGGVEWIAGTFFLFPVVYTSLVFPRKKVLFSYTVTSIYYLFLVLLPYFNIIPFKHYFYLDINLYQNPYYVINNIIFTISTFYFIGLAANVISDLLRKKTSELENERMVLEIKINARTRELEELAIDLEKKVKERTKELQIRIEELEKIHKFTVGRELKMMELKEEIKKLKNNKL